jgi:hypothetical protein
MNNPIDLIKLLVRQIKQRKAVNEEFNNPSLEDKSISYQNDGNELFNV